MSKKKKCLSPDDPLYHEGHKLKSRRDFLAQGFIAGSAYTFAPNIFGMLGANPALAAEPPCSSMTPAAAGKTPVIIFDFAGGANFAGSNVMVGGAGGQSDFLADYTTLGLPPDMHPSMAGQLDTELGLAFHSDSAILRGLRTTTSTGVRAKMDGGIFCTSSSDDTSNNPHNPAFWLNKAGSTGALSQLAGTRNTIAGGRSSAPSQSIDPTTQPVTLTRPQDALGLVNVGKLSELFNDAKAQKIMKAIERISEQKLQSLSAQSLPEQIKTLVSCGYIDSQSLINQYNAEALDPRLDTQVTTAFDNLGNSDQRKTATIAKMVLDGLIGVGTVEKGGYDYHNKTRGTGEQRDEAAGALIGRVIELAALKQKDIMIYIITDGSVAGKNEVDNSAAGRGKYIWTGDSGQRSSAFMLLYRHAGRATLRTGKRQIGNFKSSGSVDNNAGATSNSVTNLAKAIVANYMSLHGDEGNLANIVGDNPFGSQLDQYLLFNRIT
jgi:hypothetical protein